MPTKPPITIFEFASDLTYSTATAEPSTNGSVTKTDGGSSFRSEGSKIREQAFARLYNYELNQYSRALIWTMAGTNAPDEDAHIVETDSTGSVNGAYANFTGGATNVPVVQIEMPPGTLMDGMEVIGKGGGDYAIDIDMTGVTAGGTGIRIKASPTRQGLEGIGGGGKPCISVTSNNTLNPLSGTNVAFAAITDSGDAINVLSYDGRGILSNNIANGICARFSKQGGGTIGANKGAVEVDANCDGVAFYVEQQFAAKNSATFISKATATTGTTVIIDHQGTGSALVADAASGTVASYIRNSIEQLDISTSAGATFAATQYSADPVLHATKLQIWSRSIASLSRLAIKYTNSALRKFVHASKYGFVQGRSDPATGTIAEIVGTSTTVITTFSFDEEAFPVDAAGALHYRINGRVKRGTLGTLPELGAVTAELYDVTASSVASATPHPIDFVNTAAGEHWVYFTLCGKYTLPATGDRQFSVRMLVTSAGTTGVVDYENIAAEIKQADTRP